MNRTESTAPSLRSQIPRGVQDRFLADATHRRWAEARLRESFARWGYREVIPPTFEYFDNLSVGASAEFKLAMYRTFDGDGRTLALRSDFTPQIARMAATKLYDQPMPLRCSYLGSVFRGPESQVGREREFTQAGVELIGANTAAADAEVVALAAASLESLGLPEFQINLGQSAFFRVLTRDLPAGLVEPLRMAIDQKNSARLADLLGAAGLGGAQRDLLYRLPDLIGGPEILAEAEALSETLPNAARALAALGRLAQVYDLLQAHGLDRLSLDLGEVQGMDYYTGISFRGLAPGSGWPVVSGGRYDDLIAHFGRPLPAIGFGLPIERALRVLARHQEAVSDTAPQVLVQACSHPACLAMVQRLRRQACRVQVDVLDLKATALAEQARQRGITRTLRCGDGPVWRLAENGRERTLSEPELLQAARAWSPAPIETEETDP
jgi:ATP phosphoribosyltransferase regulatory subunit